MLKRVLASLTLVSVLAVLFTFGVSDVASAHSFTAPTQQASQVHAVAHQSACFGAIVTFNFLSSQCYGPHISINLGSVTSVCAGPDDNVRFNGDSIAPGDCNDYFFASGTLNT